MRTPAKYAARPRYSGSKGESPPESFHGESSCGPINESQPTVPVVPILPALAPPKTPVSLSTSVTQATVPNRPPLQNLTYLKLPPTPLYNSQFYSQNGPDRPSPLQLNFKSPSLKPDPIDFSGLQHWSPPQPDFILDKDPIVSHQPGPCPNFVVHAPVPFVDSTHVQSQMDVSREAFIHQQPSLFTPNHQQQQKRKLYVEDFSFKKSKHLGGEDVDFGFANLHLHAGGQNSTSQ